MKKNVLDLIQVLSASRQLVEASLGEECETIVVPVMLLDDNNELKEHISHSICKKSESVDAKIALRQLKGITKEEFIERNPYCHISTYSIDDAGSFLVSFDPDDSTPRKVEISKGYNYLDYFFYKFNNMRNTLIDNHERVKEDDIYQYLAMVLGPKKEEKKETKFQKIKKRLFNSK